MECLQRGNNIDAIAQKMFTSAEVAFMREPTALSRERFFRLWTLRESFVKALGTGLAGNSNNFYFTFDDAAETAEIGFADAQHDTGAEWQFGTYRPAEQHMLSVCVETAGAMDIKLQVFSGI